MPMLSVVMMFVAMQAGAAFAQPEIRVRSKVRLAGVQLSVKASAVDIRIRKWTTFFPSFPLRLGGLGATAAWLVLRAKGQHAYDRGKADAEGERIALAERIQARDQTIADLNAKIQQLEHQVQEGQAAESNLKTKLAQYATILDQERKQAEEKLEVVNQAQQKLADAFKALAAEALKSNNQSFLELAKATLENFRKPPRAIWKNASRRSRNSSSRSKSRWIRWTRRSTNWKRLGPGPTSA